MLWKHLHIWLKVIVLLSVYLLASTALALILNGTHPPVTILDQDDLVGISYHDLEITEDEITIRFGKGGTEEDSWVEWSLTGPEGLVAEGVIKIGRADPRNDAGVEVRVPEPGSFELLTNFSNPYGDQSVLVKEYPVRLSFYDNAVIVGWLVVIASWVVLVFGIMNPSNEIQGDKTTLGIILFQSVAEFISIVGMGMLP